MSCAPASSTTLSYSFQVGRGNSMHLPWLNDWRFAPGERPQLMAGGLVLLAHILAIWVLAVSLRTAWPERVGSDIAVMFIQNEPQQALAQPPLPQFKEPELDTVPPPQFEVEPDLATNAIRGAASEAGMLAPRPDPAHFNIPPALPATFKGAG